MQLRGIKNIIFDLGDVIVNINHSLTVRAFQQLMQDNYPIMEKELFAKKIAEKFEIGTCSAQEFISFIKNYSPNLTSETIIDAWNAMLLDIPEERITLIKKLSKNYRIFLLSNTNEIHLDFINQYVTKKFGLKFIAAIFEKAYYSHQMGLRKPNPEIFKLILVDKNLNAEETLFIDDSEEHIITAKQLNLKTYHLVKPETILDIFE